jgi:EAL domain-containing protein (putative c-di-GMP-specific phosphodiesterase class I)
VLRDADAALRQAKRRGKDQVQVYDAALRSTAAERIDEETALGAAIAADQLLLHYQPIIDLDTGVPTGVEALARWARPGHGMVPPVHFIALAEESGLIVDLGRWVLRRACRDAADWARTAPALAGATVSVNVSTRQLIHPRFLLDLDGAMADHALPADRLVLEITESALIEDPDAVMVTLDAIRARGVRLALDDFGTGYSSLSYVQNLPVTILKIDKSFVDPIAGPGQGTILSEVVLKLAEATGLRTVAEGVETRQQAEALRLLGCHRGQGFTWSRPVPNEQLAAAVAGICAGAT